MTVKQIYGINGPVVTVAGGDGFSMSEMVRVGRRGLSGEVISIDVEKTVIQVYEDTSGLESGENVTGTGKPLSVTLGPGMIGGIYDGIGRPLDKIAAEHGAFLPVGVELPTLNPDKRWPVRLTVLPGERLERGGVYATVRETPSVELRLFSDMAGDVVFAAKNGEYRVGDVVAKINCGGAERELTLQTSCPVRQPRTVAKRLSPSVPLVTGQRVIDSLFPIAKGGAVAIPGSFGTGKTMQQHQIAKWCDADVIIYVGCGERGNEMTQVLKEFAELVDPRNGNPLLDRTVLIANTSNMPVSAREASIYTGVTIAEYYRDMGYDVALMADSTSRWAEALREISGRLEEMPAEEGFPAYLSSRLSEFYERGGYCETLGGRRGSITLIGAVSPQGGDFSEPVTQNTKRYVRAFLGLDRDLAYSRHFPAINWITSYSEYPQELDGWYKKSIAEDFPIVRERIGAILSEENKLLDIVKLIGADVLPDDQKLTIAISRIIRLGFLQQNAFHETDTFVPLQKQYEMMKTILFLYDKARELVSRAIPVARIEESGLPDRLIRMKYEIGNDDMQAFEALRKQIEAGLEAIDDKNKTGEVEKL